MKKKKIIDMDLYYEKLDNGLEIYVIPKNDCNNIYATYNTKYGGKDNEFIPLNETKMKKFPKGIAHFLEHKLFEEEDNTNVFSFYQERGANANANTSYERTSYLFFVQQFSLLLLSLLVKTKRNLLTCAKFLSSVALLRSRILRKYSTLQTNVWNSLKTRISTKRLLLSTSTTTLSVR